MSASMFTEGTAQPPTTVTDSVADRTSRQWRSIWRLHFYAGIFAMPFIVFMALTGLIILYTQPIQDLTQADIRTVDGRGTTVAVDDQELAVEALYPNLAVTSMTMPADVFLDQFTGAALAQQDAYGYGSVSYSLDVLVSTHMGTQLGVLSRILMTAMCVLAIWSVISALVMYGKRRRTGTAGLPRRPVDVTLQRRLWLVIAAFAIAFPVWGVTALVILAIDRFVIRNIRPLRIAFGQR